MPGALVERIDAWAEEHGCERSEAVRQLVTSALDRNTSPSVTLRAPLKWMLAQTGPKKQRHACAGAGGKLVAGCQGAPCDQEWKYRPQEWVAIQSPMDWDLRDQLEALPKSVTRATGDGYWVLTPVSNLSRMKALVPRVRIYRLAPEA